MVNITVLENTEQTVSGERENESSMTKNLRYLVFPQEFYFDAVERKLCMFGNHHMKCQSYMRVSGKDLGNVLQ